MKLEFLSLSFSLFPLSLLLVLGECVNRDKPLEGARKSSGSVVRVRGAEPIRMV